MTCETCGKQMVKEGGGLYMVTFPRARCFRWFRWWCKCGVRSLWEEEEDPTNDDRMSAPWEEANA